MICHIKKAALLKKLIPPINQAAKFDDTSYRVVRTDLGDIKMICLFNWEDTESDLEVKLHSICNITDYWTGVYLGAFEDNIIIEMKQHSARLLKCTFNVDLS